MNDHLRDIRLGSLKTSLQRQADGTLFLHSTVPVPPHPARMTDLLEHWARYSPDRTFLARRNDGRDWQRISYAATRDSVRRIASALLKFDLSPERPIALLSGNDIDHALLSLAAMMIGIPFSPISPAYSLISSDFGKLKHILGLLDPQLVFCSDATKFAGAIAACCKANVHIIASRGTVATHSTSLFSSLLETAAAEAVERAHAKVGPDAIAKILFTSGSTGVPKGVITTQRMLTSNQAMMRYWLALVADEPPVLLDWLPWNHTFGGNHNFGLVLYNGGTLYIDDGKPTPQGFAESLRNLHDIIPTIYFNVPKGYEELISALRRDAGLCEKFFRGVKLAFYAAAALPRHLAEELDALAIRTIGEPLLMLNGFGATETAPCILGTTRETSEPGNIGLPLPGVTVKFVPSGGKLEARVKSPSVLPGYWRDEVNSAKAFDEDGYYKLGDALRFADVENPSKGLFFDGRITEDFKLSTGTWVSVGPLRARFIAAFAPLAKDVVIAGHGQSEICALVFPDLEVCRALLPAAAAQQTDRDVLTTSQVRDAFRSRLAAAARAGTGSSTTIVRLILLDEPPSIDANEITDKGSINQRAVLTHRAALVDELYSEARSNRVLAASE